MLQPEADRLAKALVVIVKRIRLKVIKTIFFMFLSPNLRIYILLPKSLFEYYLLDL